MKVRIDQLRIRGAGLTPEQARRLGEAVAKRLAESSWSESAPRTIRSMHLKVQSASADQIAARIRNRLK